MGLGNRFQGEKYPPGFRMGSWRGTEGDYIWGNIGQENFPVALQVRVTDLVTV